MIKSKLEQKILTWQAENGRRLTLRELSEATGLSINFIHRFRHDDWLNMSRDKLEALCTFFDCTPNDLLWVVGPESPDDE